MRSYLGEKRQLQHLQQEKEGQEPQWNQKANTQKIYI